MFFCNFTRSSDNLLRTSVEIEDDEQYKKKEAIIYHLIYSIDKFQMEFTMFLVIISQMP